jgi:hypothetical protein
VLFWRHRTTSAGVSPRHVARYGNDPRPLADALRAMVEDAGMKDRSKELAARMSNDGVARAVESLERLPR